MKKVLFAALLAFAASAPAQEDNFNDGDDAGWTQLAPLAALGGTDISVRNGRYAMSCEPSPAPQQTGPARAGAVIASRTYSKFCVMTDFVSSSTGGDLSAGVLARVQPEPGPGNVNGYALTAQLHGGDIQLSRITGEVATDLGSVDVALTTGHSYRLVLTGEGTLLQGWILDLNNLAAPLGYVRATDGSYDEGMCGLVAYDDANAAVAAEFDNYFANDGTPPSLDAVPAEGGLNLVWDATTGLGCTVQSSFDLESWFPITDPSSVVDGKLVMPQTVDPLIGTRWFRLAR